MDIAGCDVNAEAETSTVSTIVHEGKFCMMLNKVSTGLNCTEALSHCQSNMVVGDVASNIVLFDSASASLQTLSEVKAGITQ